MTVLGEPTGTELGHRATPRHRVPTARVPLFVAPQPLEVALTALVVVLTTLGAWSRLDPVTRGTAWAEDSSRFLGNAAAENDPSWALAPYSGYLHLLPRVAARLTVDHVPIDRWATSMNMTACVLAGLAAGIVYVCSRAVTASRVLRMAFAAITLAAPIVPVEVLGNMANVHTFAFWAALWVLLYRPRSMLGTWSLAALMLVLVLTEVQIVFLVPLFLLGRWTRTTTPVRAAAAAGILAQVVTTLTHPRGGAAHETTPRAAVHGYLSNLVLPGWLGSGSVASWVAGACGVAAALVLILVSVAVAVRVLRRGSPTTRGAAVAFLVYPPLLWGISWTVNGGDHPGALGWLQGPETLVMTRWAVAPSMLILAGLVLCLTATRDRRDPVRWALCGLLAVVMVTSLAGWQNQSRRSGGPVWAEGVAAAKPYCRDVPTDTLAMIPAAPNVNWAAPVPCSFLVTED